MTLVEIPKRVERKIILNQIRKIPFIFMQNSSENLLSPNIAKNIFQFIDANSSYTYIFFDDKDSRLFIMNNFPKDVLDAFDELAPGAYKSDLFRYCFMYIIGGVYLDINKTFMINLDNLIDRDYDFITCIDRDADVNYGLWQALLASPPKTLLMMECIKAVVKNVKNKYYGSSPLEPTGPQLIGKIFKSIYGSTPFKAGIYTLKDENIKLIILKEGNKAFDEYENTIIYTDQLSRNMQQQIWNTKEKIHYGELYKMHKIYNSEFNFLKNNLLYSSYLNICILILFVIFIAIYLASLNK